MASDTRQTAAVTEIQAFEIVRSVLARHGVEADDTWSDGAPPDWLDCLIACLCGAGTAQAPSVVWENALERRYKSRGRRIDLMEELISNFWNDTGGRIAARTQLRDRHASELTALLRDLRKLLQTEKSIQATQTPPTRSRRRPPTAKNENAAYMFWFLCEAGLVQPDTSGAWKASKWIVEMLIEAGIENGDKNQASRALYNKLSRQVR